MQRLAILISAVLFGLAGSGQSARDSREAALNSCLQSLSGFSDTTSAKPAFPENLAGVSLEYSASGCLGPCPSFTLTLSDGVVRFEGHEHVRARGKRTAKLTRQQFEAFLHAWYDGNLYAMRDDYCDAHCPDGTVSVVVDSFESSVTVVTPTLTKHVLVCHAKGQVPEAPNEYFDLERQILGFVKARGWV